MPWMLLRGDGPPYPFGNRATHVEMNAVPRGAFGITCQLVHHRFGPGCDLPLSIDAMIQVDAGNVPLEHVPDAVIGTLRVLGALIGSFCCSVARPGGRVVGLRPLPRAGMVRDFGPFALALFSAPADPLRARLQPLQGGKWSSGAHWTTFSL